MGRPLGKKNFGPLGSTTSTSGYPDTGDGRNVHGTNTTSATELRQRGYNIPVYKARVSSTADMDVQEGGASACYILQQKSSRRFKVNSIANGIGVCKLVGDDGSSQIDGNEMVVRGFVGTDSGTPVFVKKISGKVITGFDGNRYTWYVDNDSAENVLILTAI